LVASSRTNHNVWKLLADTADMSIFIEDRVLKCPKDDY
jgi:hypothetical protein